MRSIERWERCPAPYNRARPVYVGSIIECNLCCLGIKHILKLRGNCIAAEQVLVLAPSHRHFVNKAFTHRLQIDHAAYKAEADKRIEAAAVEAADLRQQLEAAKKEATDLQKKLDDLQQELGRTKEAAVQAQAKSKAALCSASLLLHSVESGLKEDQKSLLG